MASLPAPLPLRSKLRVVGTTALSDLRDRRRTVALTILLGALAFAIPAATSTLASHDSRAGGVVQLPMLRVERDRVFSTTIPDSLARRRNEESQKATLTFPAIFRDLDALVKGSDILEPWKLQEIILNDLFEILRNLGWVAM